MPPTPQKARKILRDKEIRGKRLTDRQRRFFGAIAGGQSRRNNQLSALRRRRNN